MLFCDLCDRGFYMECCDLFFSKVLKGDVLVFYRLFSLYFYLMYINFGNYILIIKIFFYLVIIYKNVYMIILIML